MELVRKRFTLHAKTIKAVINNAKQKGAESFLLFGDYIRDTPTLNEVIDTIRALPTRAAILGNGDIGVIYLDQTKADHWFKYHKPKYVF